MHRRCSNNRGRWVKGIHLLAPWVTKPSSLNGWKEDADPNKFDLCSYSWPFFNHVFVFSTLAWCPNQLFPLFPPDLPGLFARCCHSTSLENVSKMGRAKAGCPKSSLFFQICFLNMFLTSVHWKPLVSVTRRTVNPTFSPSGWMTPTQRQAWKSRHSQLRPMICLYLSSFAWFFQ